jgi:hypothetical protein
VVRKFTEAYSLEKSAVGEHRIPYLELLSQPGLMESRFEADHLRIGKGCE